MKDEISRVLTLVDVKSQGEEFGFYIITQINDTLIKRDSIEEE